MKLVTLCEKLQIEMETKLLSRQFPILNKQIYQNGIFERLT